MPCVSSLAQNASRADAKPRRQTPGDRHQQVEWSILAWRRACGPATLARAACPDKNVMYWQAFPPGGESDLSARHQQVVLKKKCPAVDTIIQYKAGAGGGLMWWQMN